MQNIIFVVLAGAAGTLVRYQLSDLTHRMIGNGFAWGTLTVNLIGSFLIGFFTQAGVNTNFVTPSLRLALTVGFLGAFTTFSTFSYETLGYLEKGAWSIASLNVLVNVIPGIIAVFLGVLLARAVGWGN